MHMLCENTVQYRGQEEPWLEGHASHLLGRSPVISMVWQRPYSLLGIKSPVE